MEMIENQVLSCPGRIFEGDRKKRIPSAMCQALHYDLVALHVQIQLLAANWKLGKTEQALELLRGSLSQAFPDGILMPFVENYPYIEELLKGSFFGINENFLFRITRMGERMGNAVRSVKKRRRIRRSLKYCQIVSWRLRSLWPKHMSNKKKSPRVCFYPGNCEAVHQSDLFKLQIPGDVRGEAQVSFGADGRES